MATYNVNRAKSVALTAATEDIVTLTANKRWIQILNRAGTVSAANTLYVRVGPNAGPDATPAVTVAADDALACVPGVPLYVQWPKMGTDNTSTAKVRIIATGAVDYTVQAVDLA